MIYRILLAAGDPDVAREFTALSVEAGNSDLVGIVGTAGELVAALSHSSPDVIMLHEHLGPLPVLDLARELAERVPEVGLVMLARDTRTLPSSALRAGCRGIIGLPLSLEDLATTVADTGAWAHAVRAKFEQADDQAGAGGTMLVVAGARVGSAPRRSRSVWRWRRHAPARNARYAWSTSICSRVTSVATST